jgi:hypothetical protein
MPTLKQATTPPANLKNMTWVNPAAPNGAPSPAYSMPGYDPLTLAPAPSVLAQTPDLQRQFFRPGVSQFRTSPLSPKQNLSGNAAIKGIATQVAESAGVKPTLRVPSELTPSLQTNNFLQLDWSLEETGTVFGVPPHEGGGRFDVSGTSPGDSSTPISISLAQPITQNEFAFLFIGTIGSGAANPVPTGSWTEQTFDPPYTGFSTVYTQAAVNTPITITAGAGGTAHTALAALFFTDGTIPKLLQTPVVFSGSPPVASTTLNITNHSNVAQIVTVVVANSTSKPSSASVEDTNGNEYFLVASADDGVIGGTASWLFVATGIFGGANVVTVSLDGALHGTEEVSLMEFSGIIQYKVVPEFMFLVGEMIPPTDLSLVGANGGVVNTLGAGNGGTGLTAPGTNGNVLTSNGSAWTSAPPVGFANPMTTAGMSLSEVPVELRNV